MSFILDALKKSESERQRQSGPALFEVKVAPPRHRFAIWAIALGGLLALNLVVVGWMLWRGGSSRSAAAAPAPAARAAALEASVGTEPQPANPVPAPSAIRAPAEPAANQPAANQPIAAQPALAQGETRSVAALPPQTLAVARGPSPNQGPNPSANASASVNPSATPPGPNAAGMSADDLAPAVEPATHAAQPVTGVIRETASGLPTYQEAAAEPGATIPNLRLDLHVYSPQPDQRFVFLNMTKVREGDTLPQGVHVDRITPDGVILSYRGKQFVLLRQ